jgi:small subunit ribosomal protein S2
VIPGNDDAIRSIKLITQRIGDAVVEGMQRRKEFQGRDGGEGGGEGRGRPQAEVFQSRRRSQGDQPAEGGNPEQQSN